MICMSIYMHRYDKVTSEISYSCYSGIVRCGGKAASEIIKVADPVLTSYLRDAGKMRTFPEIEAISPKVTKMGPINTPAVSGRHVLLTFANSLIFKI